MKNNFDRLLNHKPYDLVINGEKIAVNEGVFAPDSAISNSTKIVLDNLPNLKGKEILDMGTGTGIIAIICSKKGAQKVIATDVSEKAIKNAQENIKVKNIENIILVRSDLYQNVAGKFDYIFANLPVLDEIWNMNEKMISITERFLTDSGQHLKPFGKVFLSWFSVSPIEEIQEIATKLNYRYELIIE